MKKQEEELQVVAARGALEMVGEVVSVVRQNSKRIRLLLALSLLQEGNVVVVVLKGGVVEAGWRCDGGVALAWWLLRRESAGTGSGRRGGWVGIRQKSEGILHSNQQDRRNPRGGIWTQRKRRCPRIECSVTNCQDPRWI